jgi:regulator of sigma E protease
MPESPAEKAGLLPGDQFVSIDGKEVQSLKDIHDAVAHKGWGNEIVIIFLREEVRKEITVTLPTLKEE